MLTYDQYRSQLKSFNSKDGEIAYFDEGQGTPILLIHGVPTSSWLYRFVGEELVKKGFRVIAPDMLGFGASDKPEGYEIYAAKKHGERMLALMDHLGINGWTQVFHDGGGLWTWEMLQIRPDCVKKLVMLNSIIYDEGFHPPLRFERGLIGKLYASLYRSKLGQRLVINATFKNGITNRRVINKNMLEGYKKPLRSNGDLAMYYFFTQTCMKIEDYAPLHQSLNIPMRVIWGKDDKILVIKDIEEMLKTNFNLKNEDIIILDACHFIQEEQPKVIADKIAEFGRK